MSDRKEQPAQLKRRIAQLEGQLAAEQKRADQVFENYRAVSYEFVDLQLRLEAVEKALRGEA